MQKNTAEKRKPLYNLNNPSIKQKMYYAATLLGDSSVSYDLTL